VECCGPGVERQANVRARARRSGDPLRRPLKIFTLDPERARVDGGIATIDVPWEPLQPGPRGLMFEVDPRDGPLINPAVDLDDPRLLIQGGLDPSVFDVRFHQQMVYAIGARVYAQFQAALGRVIAWGFDAPKRSGRLLLRPHVAECGANATYDPETGQVSFGYFPGPEAGAGRCPPQGRVFTCLSHDAIVHEITHALLDGLRSRFNVPTSGDVPGFHEGFADLVAVFQHFTHREVLAKEIGRARGDLREAQLLARLADQLGLTTTGRPLRCAISETVVRYRPDMEPHEMGSVLLSAVFEAFVRVYERKTHRFFRLGMRSTETYLSTELVDILASQAKDLATQFLNLCIRGIDYCPPVDLQLGEYLRAVITVDRELVPDDPWGYRDALIDAFAERGIYPEGVGQLSEDALRWNAPSRTFEPILALHFSNLRFAGDPSIPAGKDELRRQAEALWEFVTRPHVADEFGLAPPGANGAEPCVVESIRTARRVGPDGQVLFDLVAEVTQRRKVIDAETGLEAKVFGGCTLIVDPEGEIRYAIVKHTLSDRRLQRQLRYQKGSPWWERAEGRFRMRGYANHLAHGFPVRP
jgi:hypothetical protein